DAPGPAAVGALRPRRGPGRGDASRVRRPPAGDVALPRAAARASGDGGRVAGRRGDAADRLPAVGEGTRPVAAVAEGRVATAAGQFQEPRHGGGRQHGEGAGAAAAGGADGGPRRPGAPPPTPPAPGCGATAPGPPATPR